MAWYICDACGARMEAEGVPARCDSCRSASMVAAEPLRARATAEEQADSPAPCASEPALEAVRTLELEEADLTVEGPPPLQAIRTLELQDSDLTESSGAASPPSAAAPAGEERALELDDMDLEPAAAPPPPPTTATDPLQPERSGTLLGDELDDLMPPPGASAPVPAPPTAAPLPASRPLRGRVAVPISRSVGPVRPPAEVDELAVAGEPPPPVRSEEPLPGQTRRLAPAAGRRGRLAAVLLGSVVGLSLVAVVTYFYAKANRPSPAEPSLLAGRPDRGGPSLPDGSPTARAASAARPTATDAEPDRPVARLPASRPIAAVALGSRSAAPGKTARTPRPAAVASGNPGAAPSPAAARPGEARRSYQEALRRLLQGDAAEAVRLFEQALRQDPRLVLAHRGLGLAYEKQGMRERACSAFERYLALQPAAQDAEAIRQRIERLK